MKSYIRFFGIITLAVVIVFSFTACEGIEVEDTEGWLTITNIPSQFENKNIIAYGYDDENVHYLTACSQMIKKGEIEYLIVKGGRAELNVYGNDPDRTKYTNFTGNDQNVRFTVMCYETRQEEGGGSGVIGYVTASFAAGAATAPFRLPQ